MRRLSDNRLSENAKYFAPSHTKANQENALISQNIILRQEISKLQPKINRAYHCMKEMEKINILKITPREKETLNYWRQVYNLAKNQEEKKKSIILSNEQKLYLLRNREVIAGKSIKMTHQKESEKPLLGSHQAKFSKHFKEFSWKKHS